MNLNTARVRTCASGITDNKNIAFSECPTAVVPSRLEQSIIEKPLKERVKNDQLSALEPIHLCVVLSTQQLSDNSRDEKGILQGSCLYRKWHLCNQIPSKHESQSVECLRRWRIWRKKNEKYICSLPWTLIWGTTSLGYIRRWKGTRSPGMLRGINVLDKVV